MLQLVIGHRNDSSCALRVWLYLRASAIPFEEIFVPLFEGCRAQVARIDSLWRECRRRYARAGPWLFGELGIADVFYAPVALRFATYSIPLSPESRAYVQAVRSMPLVREWIEAARAEEKHVAYVDLNAGPSSSDRAFS